MICPCGLKNYEECCAPFIEKNVTPTTAEELMRSRYTAYTKGDIDYIKKTSHPKDQDEFDMAAAKSWAEDSEWMGFRIIRSEQGAATDSKGIIEFIVRYKMNGQIENHHEVSTFVKIDDQWYFEDGKIITQVVNETPKVGRNEPCPCESGKKYKKCCG